MLHCEAHSGYTYMPVSILQQRSTATSLMHAFSTQNEVEAWSLQAHSGKAVSQQLNWPSNPVQESLEASKQVSMVSSVTSASSTMMPWSARDSVRLASQFCTTCRPRLLVASAFPCVFILLRLRLLLFRRRLTPLFLLNRPLLLRRLCSSRLV